MTSPSSANDDCECVSLCVCVCVCLCVCVCVCGPVIDTCDPPEYSQRYMVCVLLFSRSQLPSSIMGRGHLWIVCCLYTRLSTLSVVALRYGCGGGLMAGGCGL